LLMLLVGLLLSDQGSLFQVPAEFSRGQFCRNAGTGYSRFCCTGLWLTSTPDGDWMAGLGDHGVELDARWAAGWRSDCSGNLRTQNSWADDGGDVNRAGDRVLANPLALYWAIVIVFLQRDLERPSLNELTEPDDARAALGLLVLSNGCYSPTSNPSWLGVWALVANFILLIRWFPTIRNIRSLHRYWEESLKADWR